MSGSCDNLGAPAPNDLDDGVAQMAKAMGIRSCSNYNTSQQFSASARASIDTGLGSASGSVSTSMANSITDSVGCEQLFLSANQYASATKKISCLLTKNTAAVSDSTSNVNTIKLKAGKDLNAQDIRLNQSISVKLIKLSSLTNEQKQEISDVVQKTALASIDAVQNSKSGIGATPQGSKVCTDNKAKMTQENLTNITNETINTISNTQSNTNEIVIEAGGNLNLFKTFEANQNIVVDIVATAILSNSVSTALSSFTSELSSLTAKASQSAENLGAESLGRQAGDAAAAIAAAEKTGTYSMLSAVALAMVLVAFASRTKTGTEVDKKEKQRSFIKKILIIGFCIFGIPSSFGVWWFFKGYEDAYNIQLSATVEALRQCAADKKCLDCGQPESDECKKCAKDNCPEGIPPQHESNITWKALCITGVVIGGFCLFGYLYLVLKYVFGANKSS